MRDNIDIEALLNRAVAVVYRVVNYISGLLGVKFISEISARQYIEFSPLIIYRLEIVRYELTLFKL